MIFFWLCIFVYCITVIVRYFYFLDLAKLKTLKAIHDEFILRAFFLLTSDIKEWSSVMKALADWNKKEVLNKKFVFVNPSTYVDMYLESYKLGLKFHTLSSKKDKHVRTIRKDYRKKLINSRRNNGRPDSGNYNS